MDQPVVECNIGAGEVNQPADLSLTRIPKCPKSFSIESIISSNDNKSLDLAAESNVPSNYDKLTNPGVYFPSNVSMAAASLYNPWFHNYFIQQQKVAGNMFEMMQLNPANHSVIKEKFNEIFANNPLAVDGRVFLSTDHERNLITSSTSSAPRSVEQYFGSTENMPEMRFNDMISNNDYYKHLNSYGINCINQSSDKFEQCKIQLTNGDENDSNAQKNDMEAFGGHISDYEKSVARNEDSGAENENGDDDGDSDCNSEISLDMSPDGDNNTQGMEFFQSETHDHNNSDTKNIRFECPFSNTRKTRLVVIKNEKLINETKKFIQQFEYNSE